MYDKNFWKGTADRAVKSFVQGILVTGIGGAGIGLADIDWIMALNLSLAYALASVLTSITAAGVNSNNNISIIGGEHVDSNIAALEVEGQRGQYEAGDAAPVPEETPVDVVPADEYPNREDY